VFAKALLARPSQLGGHERAKIFLAKTKRFDKELVEQRF